MKFRIGRIRLGKKVWLTLLGLGIIAFGVWYVRNTNSKRPQNNIPNSNPVLAQTALNSEYKFEALTASKKKTEIVLRLTDAEIRKEVLIQGKPATASGDKAFLILNLEFDNADTVSKYITPVDLFRLVDDKGKKFAADVHSNMVEVAPISTKKTKIGFVVLSSQKTFKLNLGELEGEKTDLEVKF